MNRGVCLELYGAGAKAGDKDCWHRFFLCPWLAVLLVLGTAVAWARGEDLLEELKDPEVVYLEGMLPRSTTARLHHAADIYFDRTFSGVAATLAEGQAVTVLGWHSEGWLIRARQGENRVQGWVVSSAVRSVEQKSIDAAWAEKKRRDQAALAIRDKRVIPGMTREEVRQSMGRPGSTYAREEEDKTVEVWSYVRYERVPQVNWAYDSLGRWVQVVTYQRVPVGETLVEFDTDYVVAVESTRQGRR